jgi:hypothetical protein
MQAYEQMFQQGVSDIVSLCWIDHSACHCNSVCTIMERLNKWVAEGHLPRRRAAHLGSALMPDPRPSSNGRNDTLRTSLLDTLLFQHMSATEETFCKTCVATTLSWGVSVKVTYGASDSNMPFVAGPWFGLRVVPQMYCDAGGRQLLLDYGAYPYMSTAQELINFDFLMEKLGLEAGTVRKQWQRWHGRHRKRMWVAMHC